MKEAFDQAWLAPDPFDSIPEFGSQVREIETTDIAQFGPLELLPEAFTRVQLRGIGRQPLQVQPRCDPTRQELTALRNLYLSNTRVSDTGIAALQRALPNCRIVSWLR